MKGGYGDEKRRQRERDGGGCIGRRKRTRGGEKEVEVKEDR